MRKRRAYLSPEGRLKAFERDMRLLDRLLRVTHKRALVQDDSAAFGHLFAKLLERRSAMLGLDSPHRTDINLVAEVKRPSTSESLRRAIEYMCNNGQLSKETQERIRPFGFLPASDSKIIPSADPPSDVETADSAPNLHHIDELND